MGNGSWMIFHFPPAPDSNHKIRYTPKIPEQLRTIGVTGGRLHWSFPEGVDPVSYRVEDEAMAYCGQVIDDLTHLDMAICLMISPLPKEERGKNPTPKILEKYFAVWEQFCETFKDKSHLLAMNPVIESHLWQPDPDKRTHYNGFLNECTKIFRRHNPTRIISYKPWGAASRFEFESLDLPFKGNEQGYFVCSGSGSYGLGQWWDYGIWSEYTLKDLLWQMMTQGKGKAEYGLHHALEFRKRTGIEFWVDHWHWSRDNRWSDQQQLVYIEHWLSTLRESGIASAGPQAKVIWDEENEHFFTDDFTQSVLELSKKYCWRTSLTIEISGLGTVSRDPASNSSDEYTYNTEVTLTATPDPGWRFQSWSSDLNKKTNPAQITMDSNKTVQAIFVRK
ncbi:hypothetical protein ACFL6U_28445 [Planctomycetota bacterium]